MSLVDFFRKVRMLSAHDSLTRQLAESKAKGLDEIQARAVLLIKMWRMPVSHDTFARAMRLSKMLGELVIGLIMFSKRIGVAKATRDALAVDSFHDLHRSLYYTAVPLMNFARERINRIWNRQRVK